MHSWLKKELATNARINSSAPLRGMRRFEYFNPEIAEFSAGRAESVRCQHCNRQPKLDTPPFFLMRNLGLTTTLWFCLKDTSNITK